MTTSYAVFIAFVASIGGFLFGYDLVIISGAQIFLRDQFQLSPAAFGFATSSALLGCVLGPSLAGTLSDRLGRRTTLLAAAALFAGSAVGTALAGSIFTFNVWRIVGGVGIGLASVASPMYIAEVAPASRRGQLGLLYQLAITIGALAATIVSYSAAALLDPAESWRWMLASVIVPVIPFALLLLRVPQSPRWLAAKGRFVEAREVLHRIDAPEAADRELAEIKASLANEDSAGGLRELLAPHVRPALVIGIVLGILNNWTGWTGIAFYLPTIFQRAGYDSAADAILQNVLVQCGNVVLTIASMALVDRMGRRPLWLWCSAAMAIGLTLVGLSFHAHVTGPIMVVMMMLCAAPHAMGLGALPWLMMSEIYPTRVRALALSVSTTVLWVAAFSGPAAFPILEAQSERLLGSIAGVFWMYALICVVSFLWALRYLPETRGRSLEDIARSWTKTTTVTTAAVVLIVAGAIVWPMRTIARAAEPPSWPARVIEEKQLVDRRVLRYEHDSIPAWGYTAPHTFTFAVVLPERQVPRAPLLVHLHSAGGFDERELPESAYFTRRAGAEFYGLGLHCRKDVDWWWGKQDLEKNPAFEKDTTPTERRLIETVRWMMQQYPIDPDRVYLIGRSMGGSGAFSIGMPHGDLFAAMHVTVPADETMLYYRMNLPVVKQADTWTLDTTAKDYVRRVSGAGYPDPPFLLNYFSQMDKYSKHAQVLFDVMRDGRLGGITAWGPFGHTGDVHTVPLAALEFPWLSIRRNEAYPVFTRASTDSTYPGFQATGPDQIGQINAYFRWKNVEDTAARFAMELRLVDPFELSLMTRLPKPEIVADVTPRRLQRFRIEPGQRYRYTFTRGTTTIAEGTIATDEAGLVTMPRLTIAAAAATLTIQR